MYCIKKRNLFLGVILAITLTLTGFTNTKVEAKKEIIETVVNYRKLNIPQYRFTENVIKDAYVFQYNGFKITQPLKQTDKQALTYEQIAEEFQKLPKILTKNVNEIQLLDYRSIQDKYWEETYGMEDFRTYAKSGDNKIYFYANSQLSANFNNNYFKIALAHELGHSFDVSISSAKNRYSNSDEWTSIMVEDLNNKNNKYGLYCSEYSKNSNSNVEDFAESIVQYVDNKEKFAEDYPNRSKKLNELLN